jgi:hypothetical protein
MIMTRKYNKYKGYNEIIGEDPKKRVTTLAVCNKYKICTNRNCGRNYPRVETFYNGNYFMCSSFRKLVYVKYIPITEFQWKIWLKGKTNEPE